MPLNKACSLEALRENISAEIRAGRDPKQASAIAHETLREACKEAGKAVPKTDGAEDGLAVRRYDTGEFRAPVRTANGYLKCDARITRVGVFDYRLADGTKRRELRLPEEVFRGDALGSFELVPLTNEHPREKLTPKNTKRFATGMVQAVRQADQFVAADVLITDEDAITDAEAGKTQLSCGYVCDLEFAPGVTAGIPGVADGLRYDAIQRNITGNHVAMVKRGRAGAEASLHLDADDAVQMPDDSNPTGPAPGPIEETVSMKKLTIDGTEFELPEDAAAKLGDVLTKLHDSSSKLEQALSDATARADQAEEELKQLKQDQVTPEQLTEQVKARVALETVAAAVLRDDSVDLPAMSDEDIRRAVVLKVSPGAEERLDSGDEAYLRARYDAAIERWKEDEAAKPKPAHAVRGAQTVVKSDSKSARERMIEEFQKLGTEPIRATN